MSKKLPIISVTEEDHSESQSSDDSNSNDMDYNFNTGDVTDVEDLDSRADLMKSDNFKTSINTLTLPKRAQVDNDATDIEDYNDTDSDADEKSYVYPERKLSLQEFLQYGLLEQNIVDNETKEIVENKDGDFVQAQNLNQMNDYLTDCEDYNTDSELENGYEKSVCVDLDGAVADQGQVCIADITRHTKDNEESDEYDNLSVLSDISDLASALSDVAGAGVSVAEVLEMSDDEEECQIVYSGSASENEAENVYDSASNISLPPIDVAFISTDSQPRRMSTTMVANKNTFLSVAAPQEEVLTDVEKLDDSAADDSFDSDEDEKPIPRAVVLPSAGTADDAYHTDVEDILCDDVIRQSSLDIPSVSNEVLPSPHREMIVLKEDKFGDTVANVMPMDQEYQFGIHNLLKDDVHTEDEDYSCAEDLERIGSVAECLNAEALIEGEVIVSNEIYKPQPSKRLELHANTESVTDVEEIYVDGTNKRKKLKTRSMSKGKSKLLDVVRGKEDGGTDIEDMDLSERGLPSNVQINTNEKQQPHASAEKNTDIEDITADEVSDVSDNEDPPPDVGSLTLNDYVMSNSNIVVTIQTDGTQKCPTHGSRSKLQPLTMHKSSGDGSNPPNTDVEDMQCPSDADDVCDNVADGARSCICSDLNEMLNESCTVVHEQNTNSFNVEAEKLHIKGMAAETRDAHTDIEYVESDESAARASN